MVVTIITHKCSGEKYEEGGDKFHNFIMVFVFQFCRAFFSRN